MTCEEVGRLPGVDSASALICFNTGFKMVHFSKDVSTFLLKLEGDRNKNACNGACDNMGTTL